MLTVTINITITRREYVVPYGVVPCALRGPEKGNLTFQRSIMLDAERQ